MTRALSAENFAALKARRLVARDFIRFIVRNRESGAPVEDAYWSDIYAISAQVIDPDTGGVVSHDFAPGGALISISEIPMISNLTVQSVRITLSQVSARVNTLIRAYNCKQGRVQIWRGQFNPQTREMVAPAYPRFDGKIDQAPITTPKENDASGDVTLTCISNTQELTRSNPDTRSDASQRLRSATDDFFADAAVVGSWPVFWGSNNGGATIPTTPPGTTLLRGI
jgi:hypothetical protein